MAPTFNPRVPKRGKLRQVLKRPASAKHKEWQRVPYVRDPNAVHPGRADRQKWKRALPDLVKTSSASLVAMLRADGLLPKWEGALCPHCHRGSLGKLKPKTKEPGAIPKHRCSFWKCHVCINPHHAHPLFVEGTGNASTPLATQAAMLLLLLNRVPHAAIHRLLHVNHKAIFKRTVEHQPKLPGGKPYAEDETSFSPVRVLVSRPGPLDQHGAADPMVHVIHCTGSMRGRLLHEEQKNASCLCNRCPGPNCHPSCCHGVCVSMSYLPFHIYEKKITSGSSISSTHT